MATFTDILRKQRKSGKGIGGSLATAFSERAKERIDPRNYLFNRKGALTALFPGLKGYQAKTGTETLKGEGKSPDGLGGNSESILNSIDSSLRLMKSQFKMVAKNSIVLPQMARDTNITKQNTAKLVKSLGVKPTYDTDMFFKNSKARESQYLNATKEKKPTKEKKDEKEKKGFFATLLETIKDFIGPIITMITEAAKGFVETIGTAMKGLGFLALLLGPEAAFAAGIAAAAAGLIWLANLLPKPSDKALNEIRAGEEKRADEMFKKYGIDAVQDPKQRKRILEKLKGENNTPPVTDEVNPPKSTTPSGKANAQNKAGLWIDQVGAALGMERKINNPQGGGPVDRPMNGQNFGVKFKAEPFTRPFDLVVNTRSDKGDITKGGKHQVGTDLLAQVVVNKKVGDGVIDAVTGMNDEHHQKKRPGSMHVYGLGADFGFRAGATDSDKKGAVQAAKQELVSAGLVEDPKDEKKGFTILNEKKGVRGALGDHMHVEFNSKSAADMYARYAESKYPDLSPTREATNATRVPASGTKVTQPVPVSGAELKEKASAAGGSLKSDQSTYRGPSNAPIPPTQLDIDNASKSMQELKRKRLESLQQIYNDMKGEQSNQKPPVIINDNSTKVNGGQSSAAPPVVAPSVYNTALDWYMSRMA